MAASILSSKGQIVIPKEVREKLGLDAGDRVQFIEDSSGGFRIVPATGHVRDLKGIVAKPEKPVTVEDMNKAVSARAARAAGRKR